MLENDPWIPRFIFSMGVIWVLIGAAWAFIEVSGAFSAGPPSSEKNFLTVIALWGPCLLAGLALMLSPGWLASGAKYYASMTVLGVLSAVAIFGAIKMVISIVQYMTTFGGFKGIFQILLLIAYLLVGPIPVMLQAFLVFKKHQGI